MSNHKVLGIIGGGQLGSMLCQAASKINIKTKIYCDDKDAPAQNYADQFICGSYDDENKILEFANEVDVVTFEFENIPVSTLEKIKTIRPVFPDPNINFIIQDRSREKRFINDLGIKTVNYKNIKSKKDLENTDQLIPGILKTTTLGYDGKGQVVISKIEDLKAIKLDNHFILEKKINLKKEISVIISRYQDGDYVIYEPIENIHKDQILDTSTIPSTIDEKINNLSKDYTQRLADKLNYVGTMCVEYFIDEQNNLHIKTIYKSTVSEERISFLSTHIRSRFSTIRNLDNNSVIQTSHTSEIRNLASLKD